MKNHKNCDKLQISFIDSILPSPDLIAFSPQCNKAGRLRNAPRCKRVLHKGRDKVRSREAARRDDFVEACVPAGLSITVNVCGITRSRITKINYREGNEKSAVWPSPPWMEQLRARRDVVSRVLIAGTPARLDAGTPAVKAAPSKRRNSPEFTCRVRVCTRTYV